MHDLFENTILCKGCHKKMAPQDVLKNGFKMRSLVCSNCNNRILHPDDVREYEHFKELKGKHFKVKLRYVGNSYAISIPREIIDFMNEQDKKLQEMVHLSFEDLRRISLNF
jgi:protein-arginine kinase activator protein McsA